MIEHGNIYVLPAQSTPLGGRTREFIYHSEKSHAHGTQIFCKEPGGGTPKELIVTFPPHNGAMEVHNDWHLQILKKLFSKQSATAVQCRRNKIDPYAHKTGTEFKQFFKDNLLLSQSQMDALQGKAQAPVIRATPKPDLFPREIEIGAVRADKDLNYVVEKVVTRTQEADGQISEKNIYKLYAATRDDKILLLAQDPSHPNAAADLQFFYPPANSDLSMVDLGSPKATQAEIDPSIKTQAQFTQLREALKADPALKAHIILLIPNRDVKTALSNAFDRMTDDFRYPPTQKLDTDVMPDLPVPGSSGWKSKDDGETRWSASALVEELKKRGKYREPPPPPPPMLAPEPPAEPSAPPVQTLPPRPKNFVRPVLQGERPPMPVTANERVIAVPPPPKQEFLDGKTDEDFQSIKEVFGIKDTPAKTSTPPDTGVKWVDSQYEMRTPLPLSDEEKAKPVPKPKPTASYTEQEKERRQTPPSFELE